VHVLGATIGSEAIGGILLPGLVGLVLLLVPWLDRTNRDRLEYLEPPTWRPVRLGLGVGLAALIGVFTLAAYDQELGLAKSLLQVAVLVAPVGLGGLSYYLARRLTARRGVPPSAAEAGGRNVVSPFTRERSP
jgi:cytochrome b-561